jgi:hypothetical protein
MPLGFPVDPDEYIQNAMSLRYVSAAGRRSEKAGNQSLSGASFTTVADLQEHIDAFISAHNQTATPFAWTKKKVDASKAAVSLSCDSGY